jgi:hypothetical protein
MTMDDNEITAIVGWPTEPEMAKFRKVAAAAAAAERKRFKARAVQIVEWHRNDYNRQQIDPIVAELRSGL